jgi:hypothetical protein
VSKRRKKPSRQITKEQREKLSRKAKVVWKRKKLAQELVETGKRTEDYPTDHWTILQSIEARLTIAPLTDGRDYDGWRILKRMMDEENQDWLDYRDVMRILGYNDKDIRSDWFSPEL